MEKKIISCIRNNMDFERATPVKAFDKVNHSLLIPKLQHYGIIGKSVRWMQNLLANRK